MTRLKKLIVPLAAVLAAGAIAAPAAPAATEVGSDCSATTGSIEVTAIQLAQVGSALPLAAPAAGVLTKWKVNNVLPALPYTSKLKVMRPTGGVNQFTTVSESASQPLSSASVGFEARIPVQAGDHFGVGGGAGTAALWCSTGNPGDSLGVKPGDITSGMTAEYGPSAGNQLALLVTIEPDADKDGFGDETQDFCPQNAAVQVPCPVLTLDAINLPPGKTSVKVLVATDSPSEITVRASAKVPKGKKGKGTTVTQLDPVVQLVKAGSFTIYTINFNKALTDALKKLTAKKSIALDIVAEGKSLSGAISSDQLAVKVKGQKKARKKARR
jgi:hypothetical protein